MEIMEWDKRILWIETFNNIVMTYEYSRTFFFYATISAESCLWEWSVKLILIIEKAER